MNRNPNQYFDDPVAAYTRLAPHYADLSSRRQRYLLSIEDAVAGLGALTGNRTPDRKAGVL